MTMEVRVVVGGGDTSDLLSTHHGLCSVLGTLLI